MGKTLKRKSQIRGGNPQQFLSVQIFSNVSRFSFFQNANLYLKCVQILSSVTQIHCDEKIQNTFCTDLRFEKKKMWTYLKKSRRTGIIEGFRLCIQLPSICLSDQLSVSPTIFLLSERPICLKLQRGRLNWPFLQLNPSESVFLDEGFARVGQEFLTN